MISKINRTPCKIHSYTNKIIYSAILILKKKSIGKSLWCNLKKNNYVLMYRLCIKCDTSGFVQKFELILIEWDLFFFDWRHNFSIELSACYVMVWRAALQRNTAVFFPSENRGWILNCNEWLENKNVLWLQQATLCLCCHCFDKT